MKHEMPSSVRAASATIAARSPFVTHIFVPLTTYSSPSRVARHDDVARVAPGVGLREREAAAQLAGREARQPSLLLLLGAVLARSRYAAIVCVFTIPESDIQPYASSSMTPM